MRNIVAWIAVTLFFFYQYLLRVLPNAVLDTVMINFQISPALIGQISGFYYIAYVLAHIPVGILLDHIGPKKIVSLCALLTVIGTLPLAYSNSWILLAAGRIIVGLASSAGVLGVFKVIRMLFPSGKFTFMFGISAMIALLGAVYGGQPIHYMIMSFGLGDSVNIIAIVGIAIACLIYLSVADESDKLDHKPILENFKLLLHHNRWIIISVIGGLMIGPVEGFADAWAGKFFKVSYPALTMEAVSFIPSILFIGFALGSPSIGFLASKTRSYYAILMSCAITMLCCFIAILHIEFSLLNIVLLMFIIGVASSYQTIIIYLASAFAPKDISAITASCTNMLMMAFGYLFHTIIGFSLSGSGFDGRYSMVSALYVIPCSLFLAIIVLVYFNKSCKSSD